MIKVYTGSATWYDRFHANKDYAGEAQRVTSVIRAHHPGAQTLLDAACGTGRHLEHLRGEFACAGFDLDAGLLAVARDRLPGLELAQADLAEFDLHRRFDAVICLFSGSCPRRGMSGSPRRTTCTWATTVTGRWSGCGTRAGPAT